MTIEEKARKVFDEKYSGDWRNFADGYEEGYEEGYKEANEWHIERFS